MRTVSCLYRGGITPGILIGSNNINNATQHSTIHPIVRKAIPRDTCYRIIIAASADDPYTHAKLRNNQCNHHPSGPAYLRHRSRSRRSSLEAGVQGPFFPCTACDETAGTCEFSRAGSSSTLIPLLSADIRALRALTRSIQPAPWEHRFFTPETRQTLCLDMLPSLPAVCRLR
jgi:hypothetical protein